MKKEAMIATAISRRFLNLIPEMVEITKSCREGYVFVIKEKGKCVDLRVEEPGYEAENDEISFDIAVNSDLFEGDAEATVYAETITALAENLTGLVLNNEDIK